MTILDLLVVGLAAHGITDLWFNASLFADARAANDDREGLLGDLLRCSFCMNYQTSLWLTLLYAVPAIVADMDLWTAVVESCRLPVAFFAAGTIAWLINIARQSHGYDRAKVTFHGKPDAADSHPLAD